MEQAGLDSTNNPIICALDTTDLAFARNLAVELTEHVGALKLGLEFFTSHGPAGVTHLASTGLPIFLDLKLFDIPNTVSGAVAAASELGVQMLTLHVSGGKDMLQAAVQAANNASNKPELIGVTILTSMDDIDLETLGFTSAVKDQVLRYAQLADECGLDGLVCSAEEIGILRAEFGDRFRLVVPGIRPQSVEFHDQKRVVTPKEAMDRGANHIVMGRPITQADYPVQVVKGILSELA